MNNLKDIIVEKLKLSKHIDTRGSHNIEEYKSIDKKLMLQLDRYGKFQTETQQKTHCRKMVQYMNDHASVKRLAKVYNVDVLMKRWWTAIMLEWNDAILEFGKALEKFDVSLTDQHKYVTYYYEISKDMDLDSIKQHYRNYFELYDIDY